MAEAYPNLFPIAAAITNKPKIAEEVVSIAVVSALLQIEQAKCRAATPGQFHAWVRAIVRNQSKTAIGAGKDRSKRRSLCRGDILADLHAENIQDRYAGFLQAVSEEAGD
jgi:DNA-directed RNA polymerase specialized sigma24 family protein